MGTCPGEKGIVYARKHPYITVEDSSVSQSV